MTIIDYRNYGNRLQNYALQCLLNNYGIDAVTILNEKYHDYTNIKCSLRKKILHIMHVLFWNMYDVAVRDTHSFRYIKKSSTLMKKRIQNNLRFTQRYIKETNYVVREGVWKKRQLRQFDVVFAGSDQIWNPYMGTGSGMFFLQNVKPDRRVAFAASFGIAEIPEETKIQMQKYISEMKYISVREISGKRLVKELCGRDVPVLLDPTMLVPTETWHELLSNEKSKTPDKYILTYMLGVLPQKEREHLKSIAQNIGANIVALNDIHEESYFTINAADFLNFIRNAEIILTDSYHACVFSILFHKNFYVLKRCGEHDNIYSRITHLLDVFELQQQEIETLDVISGKPKELNEDTIRKINTILNKERNKSKQFLDMVLGSQPS